MFDLRGFSYMIPSTGVVPQKMPSTWVQQPELGTSRHLIEML